LVVGGLFEQFTAYGDALYVLDYSGERAFKLFGFGENGRQTNTSPAPSARRIIGHQWRKAFHRNNFKSNESIPPPPTLGPCVLS